jgi:hypothetical protein
LLQVDHRALIEVERDELTLGRRVLTLCSSLNRRCLGIDRDSTNYGYLRDLV